MAEAAVEEKAAQAAPHTDADESVTNKKDEGTHEGGAVKAVEAVEAVGAVEAPKQDDAKDGDDVNDQTANDEKNGAKPHDKSHDATEKTGNDEDYTEQAVSAHQRDYKQRGHRPLRRSDRDNRNRSNFESQEESNDPIDIRRQVEFYFGNSNLPTDDFLLSQTGGSKNRPVPLKTIHSFKRMRHFQPYSAVRDAVKASNFLNLSEVDDITRKIPLDSRFGDDPVANRPLVHSISMARSVYVKGFGREVPSTQLDIEAFFEPYGSINSVRLRRHDDGHFKGSVFVEFETEELAQAFLALERKPRWIVAHKQDVEKVGEVQESEEKDQEKDEEGKNAEKTGNEAGEEGVELEIMSKQEYVDLKHEGILDGTVKPRSPTRGHRGGRGDRSRGRGDRKGGREWVDKDDWKGRRDHDQRGDRRGGRGRGGRRGGRGGRGNRGGRDDRDDRRRGRDRDDDGDVQPPSRAEAEATRSAKGGDATDSNAESKKRGREAGDDGEADKSDAKKTKEDN